MTDFQFHDKIEIHWLDTVIDSDWLSLEKAKERPSDMDCFSLGHYLKEDNEAVYFCPARGLTDKDTMSRGVIPKGCIISIKRLVYEEDAIRTENSQTQNT